MNRLLLYPLSSLAKVFPHGIYGDPLQTASLLTGEEYSFQIGLLYTSSQRGKQNFQIDILSPLSDALTFREVGIVPSELPAYESADSDYLTKKSGFYPAPLFPAETKIELVPGTYRSYWFTIKPEAKPGRYPIEITVYSKELKIRESVCLEFEILPISLPEQTLLYTQWFHVDCIASYYQTEIYSERHWELIEKFMVTAAKNGINLLLTPIFTPPLDTEVGGERPAVQLVTVKKQNGSYQFSFEKLDRYIETAKRAGITHFELSHLFTQWGAEFAPKIMLTQEDGSQEKLFGWETRADSDEYTSFLHSFLPALVSYLRQKGLEKNCWFHISDEPSFASLSTYEKGHHFLMNYLSEFSMLDALSDYAFYQKGLVQTPVVAINAMEPFLKNKVSPLWGYYCCAQDYLVSNRFLSMPSVRNRIIGIQIYKFQLTGFLHWGYNFYYSQFSKKAIDPYLVTDAVSAFPSGDAFSVYPGTDEPVESIGLKVFHEALQDHRALLLLESKIGRAAVLEEVERGISPITFESYPREESWLLDLRKRINQRLSECAEQVSIG